MQNGLDLSSLVNDEYHHDPREYNQDPRLHSHASSVQAQALLKGVDAPFYHQQSHSSFEGQHGGQHRHLQHEHQGSPHTPDQQQHQPQQTHPNIRPYPPAFMHAEGQHNEMVHEGGQDEVFQPSPSLGAHNEQAHAAIAPNGPLPQTDEKKNEDRKGRVGQAGFGPPPPPLVPNPPNLEAWRKRLFDVNETITLSEEECVADLPIPTLPLLPFTEPKLISLPYRYYTYFPHIDNVYSHRSTQKYKRKPFVSHYWDCRLKGRPPGTPKSDDPAKKKRKRTARERDLCDVKIKITEFFEGAGTLAVGGVNGEGEGGDDEQQDEQVQDGQQHPPQRPDGNQNNDAANFFSSQTSSSQHPSSQPPNPFHPPLSSSQPLSLQLSRPHPGAHGARYFTIQRVNGNGGNGKGDGVAGPHKHTLAESDKVKKNSVVRWMAREGKGTRKATGLRGGHLPQNTKKASGEAANTIRKHSKMLPKDNDRGVVLVGDCTDIDTQRVWIALEVLNIPYQYMETSPKSAMQCLPDVCAKPEIPVIKKGDWTIVGTSAILEYLNEVVEHSHTMKEDIAATGGTPFNATKKATGEGGTPVRRTATRTASLPNPQLPQPDASLQNATQRGFVMESPVPWAGATAPVHPYVTRSLLPNGPADRAYARQWAVFVSSAIVSAYEAYLRSTSGDRRTGEGTGMHNGHHVVPGPVYEALKNSIVRLIAAAHPVGPFFAGREISLVDVVFAPLVMRLKWLLSNRGWKEPEVGSRWAGWVEAIEGCQEVRRTCCDAEAYVRAWAEERRSMEKEGEMERRSSGGDDI